MPCGPAGPGTATGQRPARRGRSARRGRGGGGQGLCGPWRAKGQRGAVAGAMAPARVTVKVLSPLRADQETQRVSPARAGRCPVDRSVQEQRRPAPGPAGAKRPPWAGRALAGGFGPRLDKGQRSAVAGAMAPARETGHPGMHRNAPPGGNRKRDPRFPRPRGTVPCRPAGSGTTKGQRPTLRGRSARRGRVGRWPGALAPGGPRISAALWQGRWPLPLQR